MHKQVAVEKASNLSLIWTFHLLVQVQHCATIPQVPETSESVVETEYSYTRKHCEN